MNVGASGLGENRLPLSQSLLMQNQTITLMWKLVTQADALNHKHAFISPLLHVSLSTRTHTPKQKLLLRTHTRTQASSCFLRVGTEQFPLWAHQPGISRNTRSCYRLQRSFKQLFNTLWVLQIKQNCPLVYWYLARCSIHTNFSILFHPSFFSLTTLSSSIFCAFYISYIKVSQGVNPHPQQSRTDHPSSPHEL